MHRRLAPEIFRKRCLIEGFFARPEVGSQTLIEYLAHVTGALGLRMYADPIVHQTSGQGKEANEGYDAFVPLIDSGIYVCIWSRPRFLSIIIYTCAEFDAKRAETLTAEFFDIAETDAFLF